MIYCSHLLEHLNYVEAMRFLGKCKRVLKEDGVMRILVPDYDIISVVEKGGCMKVYDDDMPEAFKEESFNDRYIHGLECGHLIGIDMPKDLAG